MISESVHQDFKIENESLVATVIFMEGLKQGFGCELGSSLIYSLECRAYSVVRCDEMLLGLAHGFIKMRSKTVAHRLGTNNNESGRVSIK